MCALVVCGVYHGDRHHFTNLFCCRGLEVKVLVINHLVNRVSFLHLHLFNLMPSDGVGLETSARVFLNTTANSGVSLYPPSPCYLNCCSLCYCFLFQLLAGIIARLLCFAWFAFHNSLLLVCFFQTLPVLYYLVLFYAVQCIFNVVVMYTLIWHALNILLLSGCCWKSYKNDTLILLKYCYVILWKHNC